MHNVQITAFGFAARSGKGEVCEHLLKLYKGSRVLKTSFARALRSEIHEEMYQVCADEYVSPREALEVMCNRMGVKFDPFAIRDSANSHGKQRALLQAWGMSKLAENPNYWVAKVAHEIEVKQPGLVLIDDLRFISEANWVKSQGGVTVHVSRTGRTGLTGAEAEHVSEHELSNYPFDHVLLNDSSLKVLHTRAADLYRNILNYKLFP